MNTPEMLKFFSRTILKLIGWKVDVTLPEEKKMVLIGAPHTTNWDLPKGGVIRLSLFVKA